MIYNRFGSVATIVEKYAQIILGEPDSFLGEDTTIPVTPVKIRFVSVSESLRADNGIVEIQEEVAAAPSGVLTNKQIEDLRRRFS
jgi:hypothetical protein